MAAGEGTRLRPLTARWAKPVLPIDGRPVISTLLRELAAAGLQHVALVTGHLAEQVEELVGDGRPFGLEIHVVRQPRALGSADAVIRGLTRVAPPTLVTAADTVYTRGDVGRFLRAYAESGAVGALAVRRDPPPSPGHRSRVRIERGLVRKIVDDDPSNPLASAPLWVLGPAISPYLEGLSGPPYELAEAFQRAIDDGLPVAGTEIGRPRDLTFPVDLVEQNFPYAAALK